jgi:hypothetical protein
MRLREVQYNESILLVGNLVWEDQSFSHEFGRESVDNYTVEDLHIILYVDGFDYDMTKSFKDSYPATFEAFEKEFIRRLING